MIQFIWKHNKDINDNKTDNKRRESIRFRKRREGDFHAKRKGQGATNTSYEVFVLMDLWEKELFWSLLRKLDLS